MLQVIKKQNQLCVNYYAKVSLTFPNANKIIWLRQVKTQFQDDKKRKYSSLRNRHRVLYAKSGHNILPRTGSKSEAAAKRKGICPLFVLEHMPTYI